MWWRTSNCSSLLIYRPQKDERLSWPGNAEILPEKFSCRSLHFVVCLTETWSTWTVVCTWAAITPDRQSPSSLHVKAVNSTALEVTWSATQCAEYYQLTCDSCDGLNISTNDTTYVIGGLEPGTYHTISVVACAASLCSDWIRDTNNTCTLLCAVASNIRLL